MSLASCRPWPSVLLLVATLALPATASAESGTSYVWTVTSLSDAAGSADSAPGDGTCASTLPGTPCTLRAAIQESDRSGSSDDHRIDLPAGRVDLSSPLPTLGNDRVRIKGVATGERSTISGQNAVRPLQLPSGARLTLTDLDLVQGFTAGQGGTILADGPVDLRLDRVRIADGASGGFGGAVNVAYGGSNVEINESTFESNDAVNGGGALFLEAIPPGTLQTEIRASAFIGNRATGAGATGGAIIAFAYSGDGALETTIENTTFADNSAAASGGALALQANSADDLTELSFVTATGSVAPVGNGAFDLFREGAAPAPAIHGLVLQDNPSGGCLLPEPSATASLSDDTSCGFAGTASANTVDALLGPVSLQGGLVPVALPSTGSPALGRSTAVACMTALNPSYLDARGYERFATGDSACDAGAAERVVTDAIASMSGPATATAGQTASFTAGVRAANDRSPQGILVTLTPAPGAEIVDFDAHPPTTPEAVLSCTRDGAALRCVVNGGLGTDPPRTVGVRLRRATAGPLTLTAVVTSDTIEATPEDNTATAGPTVPAPPVTGPSGPSAPTPTPTVTPTPAASTAAPVVTRLAVKRNARTKRYAASFTLSKAGRVQLLLERRVVRRGRARFVRVTTITRALTAGKRTIVLPARLERQALPRGSYRVSVRAFGPTGRGGATVRKAFRLR